MGGTRSFLHQPLRNIMVLTILILNDNGERSKKVGSLLYDHGRMTRPRYIIFFNGAPCPQQHLHRLKTESQLLHRTHSTSDCSQPLSLLATFPSSQTSSLCWVLVIAPHHGYQCGYRLGVEIRPTLLEPTNQSLTLCV